jgi:hypothetical protein
MQEPNWAMIEGSGSVFGNATRSDLEELVVPWPERASDRRAIAHILGTLDDKIELNRRMSETLEAMARAVFKSWFVDFDPVRAKMEGRWQRGQSLPGLPEHLYDLFPDSFEDSELGEIPKGWGGSHTSRADRSQSWSFVTHGGHCALPGHGEHANSGIQSGLGDRASVQFRQAIYERRHLDCSNNALP